MKKVLAAALAVTIIIGLAGPAVFEENEGGKGLSFNEAIETLYAQSQDITDEEVMETAQEMNSDLGGAEQVLGAEAAEVARCLDLFEEAKAAYILGENKDAGAFAAEWAEEAAYAGQLFSEEQTLCTLVPRYRVDAYEVTDNGLRLDIYEWMTAGYTEGASEEINTTAFGFTFSVDMAREKNSWNVVSVSGSGENAGWMQSEAQQAADFEAELAAEKQESFLEQAAREMSGITANAAATEPILSYVYSREKAVAYGDKWALKRNTAVYKDYSRVGGDCANFTSQCLAAGGMPTSGTSFYDGWHKNSLSWINVMAHIKHFKVYGKHMTATKENTLKGNPVYFDWNGDGTWDHATLCVGKNSAGTPIIDSHTADLYHATWSYSAAKKISTIQLYDTSAQALKGSKTTTQAVVEPVTNGWSKENGSWYFYKDAKKLTGWVEDAGKKYYLNENGVMMSGWITVDNNRYYMHSAGYMATGWKQKNGNWYYLHPETGIMQTGMITVDGKQYYMDPETGIMKTGWIQVDSTWYYARSGGALAKGWLKKNGRWYYLDAETGAMTTGWAKISGKWYYMNKSGTMRTGWLNENGSKYYLKKNGQMATGRVKINGKWYRFTNAGKLKK